MIISDRLIEQELSATQTIKGYFLELLAKDNHPTSIQSLLQDDSINGAYALLEEMRKTPEGDALTDRICDTIILNGLCGANVPYAMARRVVRSLPGENISR